MKAYVVNYNGVMDSVIELLKSKDEYTDDFHNADIWVLWQDVRGECRELCEIAQTGLGKPVVVLQHGRGATRDYAAPNKFELKADKILVWGESERRRLLSCGISDDKIAVVGCPLLPRLKPKSKGRQGINVLFVPVISDREEPENILVYQVLRIWEAGRCIKRIYRDFDRFKAGWAWQNDTLKEIILPDGTMERRLWKSEVKPVLPRWITYGDGLVNVKLTGVHDMNQYQSPLLMTNQNDPKLIDSLVDLLTNIDAMVCLEEGTMQLMACALDIPVIVADIFKYRSYGGCDNYDEVEKIHTKAVYHTSDINKLPHLLDIALAHPAELRRQRIKVVEDEGAPHLGNANEKIVEEIKKIANAKTIVTDFISESRKDAIEA